MKMTSCWILTEQGLKGTENQCIALATAAGLSPELKQIKLRNPWKFFTPWVRAFKPAALAKNSSELTAPWPDVLIASGRKAIAPALWIKEQSGDKTKLVIVQSPVVKDANFDLVIVPQHDHYDGKNVLKINGALSLVTHETLTTAYHQFASVLESLPAPRIAVLIGGNSRTHKITPQVTRLLIMQLKKLLHENYSLMITASRRTPQAMQNQIRNELARHCGLDPQSLGNLSSGLSQGSRRGGRDDGKGSIHFWDGTGDNPYQAYLAWADAILVTEDSVSMASEAISTGKPVYIIRLEGGSKRFKRFHDNLIAKGYTRWFTGQINDWSYEVPDDLEKAAIALRNLLT
jgi:mitochondrial fission protein ELM1